MKQSVVFVILALWLAACVTVNVYFPEAATEHAARTIVRDVIGNENPGGGDTAPAEGQAPAGTDQGRWVEPDASVSLALLHGLLNLLVSPARAQANININTPAIDQLRASLHEGYARLEPYLTSGAVGMTHEGLMAVRDLGAVPLSERGQLNRLLATQNEELNALYREIARANNHPEWEPQIRATFVEVWLEELPAGTWYQGPGGNWRQN